jgi:hypothetical protein
MAVAGQGEEHDPGRERRGEPLGQEEREASDRAPRHRMLSVREERTSFRW